MHTTCSLLVLFAILTSPCSAMAARSGLDATTYFSRLSLVRPWLDLHVYYTPETRNDAVAVRSALKSAFPKYQVYDMVDRPVGPHPIPMFEVHLPPQDASAVVAWLQKNGRGLRAMIHPHSHEGPRKDHSVHIYWVSDPLPLNFAIFDQHGM
eukprot:TRINITY_DN45690_c0_g1_i1.p1 TRINITY_DN45690_c0_g1~~TRINITY_DN45690_c0_g1_i1.p1  ORF type:complete len:152 (-),score=7.81 TRINITY_DN45690_c0_g1_i1:171-626(-)